MNFMGKVTLRRVWKATLALLLAVLALLAGLRLGGSSSALARRHADEPASARATAARYRTVRRALDDVARQNWIAAWGAAPQPATPGTAARRGFADQTIREIVRSTIGGSAARIELSNAYGSAPLTVGGASIAAAGTGAAVGTDGTHELTFGGRSGVVIPPGAEAISDPVALTVRPLERLAVSLYLPRRTGPATQHLLARATTYVGGGDRAGQPDAGGFAARTASWYFLSALDVLAPRRDLGAVVALGDSITDGVGARNDAYDRWTDDLADRLGRRAAASLAVVDEGIGGNRVLNNSPCCGENALARFGRDVVARLRARVVILLEGINDIGFARQSSARTRPHTDVSAAEIIAGYEQLIAEAHAHGLRIFGATLTPFRGARYWSAAGEAKREAVNRWIRTSGAFDGVIDFARAVADPRDRQRLAPRYDSGDHLHPNAAGYRAMAATIDPAALVRAAQAAGA
jgi:lysophospholipase L1-like esterase